MARLLRGEDSESTGLCKHLPAHYRLPRSNLNITSASGQQPRSRRTWAKELLFSPIQSVCCQFASLSLKHHRRWSQAKTPPPFDTWETQKGRGILQHALDRRWLLLHPLTSHSPEPHVPLWIWSLSLPIWQSTPTAKQVLTWFSRSVNQRG